MKADIMTGAAVAVAACCSAVVANGAWNDVDIKPVPVTQNRAVTVDGEAASLLPPGKKWKLVWHDEFNGSEIDKTKWMCRESFWGADFPAFAHDFKGVEMTGNTVRLHLMRDGDQFSSPHLQTGSLTYDIPKDASGFWPFGRYRKPLFMHKYGYYEIRCRQPKYAGWYPRFACRAVHTGLNRASRVQADKQRRRIVRGASRVGQAGSQVVRGCPAGLL